MASHTPGPYIACNGCEIRTPDGKWVADAWNSCDANTSEYNAKLLAAAPELLAALEGARRELGKQNLQAAKKHRQTDESLALLAQIDAAIRAARAE